jgi:hypothetical protein
MMIKKYVDYIKNNPEGYWFKRKLYGWGWTPAKWQGWAVIAIYLVVILYTAVDIDSRSHSVSDMMIGLFAPLVVATGILIYICYKKGERPRWQWGIPKD